MTSWGRSCGKRNEPMAATLATVRTLAFALPSVEEKECYGTPAFYVRKKLILRLWEDGETLVVAFPKTLRSELIDGQPDVFSVTDHYRNYDSVLLDLLAASETLLKHMIEGAWRMKATKKQVIDFEARREEREASGA